MERQTHRQRKMRNDYSSHYKPQLRPKKKKLGELMYLWDSFGFKSYANFEE